MIQYSQNHRKNSWNIYANGSCLAKSIYSCLNRQHVRYLHKRVRRWRNRDRTSRCLVHSPLDVAGGLVKLVRKNHPTMIYKTIGENVEPVISKGYYWSIQQMMNCWRWLLIKLHPATVVIAIQLPGILMLLMTQFLFVNDFQNHIMYLKER